jgi:uncharacterized protein (DUF1800 family)
MIKEWWLREIVMTPSPLTERMIAFWTNHFVANLDDAEYPRIGFAWLSFMRANVSGNFRTFAHDMCLQPAMMHYLNNRSNVAVAPAGSLPGAVKNLPSNENFGRELLELFLLGEGHIYSEEDVINVARAFTGHNLDKQHQYVFYPDKHDASTDMIIFAGSSAKNYGGKSGDVYDIIDQIIHKVEGGDTVPRTARLIVEKLWAEFIGTPIADNTASITGLAGIFYGGGAWDLKTLYKALFKHPEFKNTDVARKMIKMPIEFIAGFYRSLSLRPKNERWDGLVYASSGEEQDPLSPPIVKGWLGGKTWINAKTLLERYLHMGWWGWDMYSLTDKALPQALSDTSLTEFLHNIPPILPESTPVPPWWENNILAFRIRELIKDPAYNIK